MQKVKLIVFEHHEFQDRYLYLLIAFLAFSAYQNSDTKSLMIFLLKLQVHKLSSEILMKELNHVVTEESELQHSAKSKLFILLRITLYYIYDYSIFYYSLFSIIFIMKVGTL